jgi:hypothetical protein
LLSQTIIALLLLLLLLLLLHAKWRRKVLTAIAPPALCIPKTVLQAHFRCSAAPACFIHQALLPPFCKSSRHAAIYAVAAAASAVANCAPLLTGGFATLVPCHGMGACVTHTYEQDLYEKRMRREARAKVVVPQRQDNS